MNIAVVPAAPGSLPFPVVLLSRPALLSYLEDVRDLCIATRQELFLHLVPSSRIFELHGDNVCGGLAVAAGNGLQRQIESIRGRLVWKCR